MLFDWGVGCSESRGEIKKFLSSSALYMVGGSVGCGFALA